MDSSPIARLSYDLSLCLNKYKSESVAKNHLSLSHFGEAHDKEYSGSSFFIYTLIQDGFAINIGLVIISPMKKARFQQGCMYGFGGLLTRFFKGHGIEEEDLDYRLLLETRSIDVTQIWGLDISYGPMLTLLENHAWDNKIITYIYEIKIIQL